MTSLLPYGLHAIWLNMVPIERQMRQSVKLFTDQSLASDHRFPANHLGLYFSCAAYVLHHTLRCVILQQIELSNAQTLQTDGACGRVQRSDQTATARPMTSELIAASCNGNPVSSAAAMAENRWIGLSSE